MALIRTKRATTASQNGGPGQPKSKYRKRSVSRASLNIPHSDSSNPPPFIQRATPPGKCHSCNIRETPEWRRGPDGARTLCNACGLREFIFFSSVGLYSHYSRPRIIDYAKLMRKRDKAAGPDGKAPSIDLEMLRASTRMADNSNRDASNRNSNPSSGSNNNGNHSVSASGPIEAKPPPPSPPSQKSDSARPSPAVSKAGPPQSPVSPATSTYHPNPSGPGVPPQQQPPHATQMMPPPSIASGTGDATPPTWHTARGYPAEHGSFMRSHARPSHARGAPQ
jgi:hypothetical protein